MSSASGGASAGPESEASGGTESDGSASKPPTKRAKGKSKVWDRVAWFTRGRSRSKENQDSIDGACPAPGPSNEHRLSFGEREMEVSPPSSLADTSPNQSVFWLGSSSSSETDLYDGGVKKSRLYPNSEVIEQNCLRPSVARALFMQLEASGQRGGSKPPKYSWQKKRKTHKRDSLCGEDIEEPLSRTLSMPGGIAATVSTAACHCIACCSCSPSQRLQGSCPAFVFARRSTSTTSLDTALLNIGASKHYEHYDASTECSQQSSVRLHKSKADNMSQQICDSSHLTESCSDAPTYSGPAHQLMMADTDSEQYKSNSLPSYYSHAFHRKCKSCGKNIRISHLPLSHDVTTSPLAQSPDQADIKLPYVASSNFCQCKQFRPRSPPTIELRPSVADHNIDVVQVNTPNYVPIEPVKPQDFKHKMQLMSEWFGKFDDSQRNLVLKQMLGQCELPQMHLLSLALQDRLHLGCPPNCSDSLGWLPPPIATYILTFLDPVSLCQASMTCRQWRELASDPSLWRRLCAQPKWRLSRVGEQKQLLQHMMPNGSVHWKRVFGERYKLCNNWLKGRCNVRTFEGHTQGISCVQFDDTRIVSGSSDKTIKVWNIRTNSPWAVQTLAGHSGTVRCLHLDGNRLVSGSTDRSIKVWDLSTQQSWSSIACKVTMVGHLDTVRCIQVDEEKVISGSYDKSLKVWDIRTGHCTMSLRGHEAAVLCVQFDKTKIVSGSCDKTIKVWNFNGDCMMTLRGHHDAVTCLQFDDTRIISGSLDCNLKFWHIQTGECSNTIDWKASEGHTGVVRCLQADSWRVVSASDDRTLKVWSLETGQRLVTLRNHTDGVTCLQFNDSIIVSGSYDKTVKLWDFGCC